MRSSGVIRSDINENENDKKKLLKLRNGLSNLGMSISGISSSFIKAGTAIEESGDISGVPFDHGKLKEYGQNFLKSYENITDVINDINSAISKIDDTLVDLRRELSSREAYEAEQRKLALNNDEKNSSKTNNLNNKKNNTKKQ